GAVAEQAVVAQGVDRYVIASVRALVAHVARARDAVATVDRRARLAAGEHVARLGAVAEQAVAARRVVRRVIAGVGGLVAGIDSASDRVGAVRRRAGL